MVSIHLITNLARNKPMERCRLNALKGLLAAGVAIGLVTNPLQADDRNEPTRPLAPVVSPAIAPPATPDPAVIEQLRATGLAVQLGGVLGHDLRFWLVTDAEGRQAFIATTQEGFLIRGRVYAPEGALYLDTEGPTPLYGSERERRAQGLARLTGVPRRADTDLTWRVPNTPGATPSGATVLGAMTPGATVWDQLGHATVIEEGRAGAPLVYIFFDPDCPYCHQQWDALRKKVTAGALRVRWVPVAVLTTSQANLGVVGGLLADPRAETLTGWMRTRRVRLDASEAAKRALGLNMALFQALKVPSVPAAIYKDQTGRLVRKVGVADL